MAMSVTKQDSLRAIRVENEQLKVIVAKEFHKPFRYIHLLGKI
jgi:hypothetical protein